MFPFLWRLALRKVRILSKFYMEVNILSGWIYDRSVSTHPAASEGFPPFFSYHHHFLLSVLFFLSFSCIKSFSFLNIFHECVGVFVKVDENPPFTPWLTHGYLGCVHFSLSGLAVHPLLSQIGIAVVTATNRC